DLPEIHHLMFPIGVRALDGDRVTIEVVVTLKRLDDEEVEGKPDGPAPVAVAAEQARGGFSGCVINAELFAPGFEHIRMSFVDSAERTDSEGREELLLVEQIFQHADEALA